MAFSGNGAGTSGDPYQITSWAQLQEMNNDLDKYFILMNDLDENSTGYDTYASSTANSGAGWLPIGDDSDRFTGSFDGQNYTISDLYINGGNYKGLFGSVSSTGIIESIHLRNIDITGDWYIGGLAGASGGTINRVSVQGVINGSDSYIGCLVGENIGLINECYTSGEVQGGSRAGGLVGHHQSPTSSEEILNCYSDASVNGTSYVGGLIGNNYYGRVMGSFSKGNVSGTLYVGGFAGHHQYGFIESCYSNGNVTRLSGTSTSFGGFTSTVERARIIKCYSTGKVIYTGAENPTNRGFISRVFLSPIYDNSYYFMQGNFWDMESSEQQTSGGNTTNNSNLPIGLTSSEMKNITNFIEDDWDIDNIYSERIAVWYVDQRRDYPRLFYEKEEFTNLNSEIAGDIILKSDLSPVIIPNSTQIDKFICNNSISYERLNKLRESVDYQLRYNPDERDLYYEPRGFIDNSVTLITGTDILGLPEWGETTDGMINDLRIDGATTETKKTEEGIIGTDEGFTIDYISLERKPTSVELIIDGEQKIGGSKGAVNTYYYVDFEQKKIYPQSGNFPAESVIVNYNWMAPIPIRRKKTPSIESYGLFEEVVFMPDIVNLSDGLGRLNSILEKRSEPFTIGKLKVRNSVAENLQVGELVTIIDNLNTPNIDDKFVITKIKRVFPSGYTEIEVGDKEWKLEDDIIEMENRIKRLEERFTLESELITQVSDIDNFTDYIKHKHLIIRKGEYNTTKKYLLLGGSQYSDLTQYYLTDPSDEEAFDWTVHQDTS